MHFRVGIYDFALPSQIFHFLISKQVFFSSQFGENLRNGQDSKESKIQKEKPNFEPSGKLAEDTNMYRGVVIKYNEPSDAHLPKLRWRLYPFKVSCFSIKSLPTLGNVEIIIFTFSIHR